MTSPIGVVPAFFDIGYDNQTGPVSQTICYPWMPVPVAAGTYSTGSVNTASTETTGTQTFSTFARLTTAQLYMNPMVVPVDVVYREVEMGISGNTVAGTGSVTGGWMMGIYKQSTTWATDSASETTSGTLISNLSKFGYGFNASQNSVTAGSYLLWRGTDPNNTSNTLYASSTSGTGTMSNLFTGQRDINLTSGATASTLSAGQYYVVHGFTKTSAGANVLSVPHGMFVSNSLTAGMGTYFGSTNWQAPTKAYVGSFTTRVSTIDTGGVGTANVPQNLNCLPDTLASSQVSATGSADVKWLQPTFYY